MIPTKARFATLKYFYILMKLSREVPLIVKLEFDLLLGSLLVRLGSSGLCTLSPLTTT